MGGPPGASASGRARRGLSPLVANLLLVAVIIVVGATVGFGALTVMGLDDVGPIADFHVENETTGVVVTQTQGETIDAANLLVRVDDPDDAVTDGSWDALGGETDGELSRRAIR
jgi:flagellin-like protein